MSERKLTWILIGIMAVLSALIWFSIHGFMKELHKVCPEGLARCIGAETAKAMKQFERGYEEGSQ